MAVREGFPGQRLVTLPRLLVDRQLSTPPTSALVVTDAGYFPNAKNHIRAREGGSPGHILLVCTEGNGWCVLDEERHDISTGQLAVIPANHPHSYGADEDHPWSIWWLHLEGSMVADLMTASRISRDRPVIEPRRLHRVTGLMDEIVTQLEDGVTPTANLVTSGAAWHLMSLLADQFNFARGRVDPVKQSLEILKSRLTERISVAELAKLVGLSSSHLSALFKKNTGLGILEYHIAQRLALARDLLDTTDLPIAQVAKETGYSDPFYFSRQFHRTHGMSPRTYREATKG